MEYVATVGPTWEPVTVAEAKAHLRITHAEEDFLLAMLVQSARQIAENFTGRVFTTRTMEMYLDEFPSCTRSQGNTNILLPVAPVQSVELITYIDANGTVQTLSDTLYSSYLANFKPSIAPVYGETWPTTRDEMNAVTVNFIAGYARPDDIPGPIKSAILLLIGELYENRENSTPIQIYQVPRASESLLYPYKIHF